MPRVPATSLLRSIPVQPGAEISTDFKLDSSDKSITTWPYAFEFRFTGQATFYIDDLQLQEKL